MVNKRSVAYMEGASNCKLGNQVGGGFEISWEPRGEILALSEHLGYVRGKWEGGKWEGSKHRDMCRSLMMKGTIREARIHWLWKERQERRSYIKTLHKLFLQFSTWNGNCHHNLIFGLPLASCPFNLCWQHVACKKSLLLSEPRHTLKGRKWTVTKGTVVLIYIEADFIPNLKSLNQAASSEQSNWSYPCGW